MDNFSKEDLHIIQRALICMSGVVAAINNVKEYQEIHELGNKIRSEIRGREMMEQDDE